MYCFSNENVKKNLYLLVLHIEMETYCFETKRKIRRRCENAWVYRNTEVGLGGRLNDERQESTLGLKIW